MEVSRLTGTSPRLIFFGGKGGVGKTTCAAARAVTEAASGARVLAVSTDPAHSLGDVLGIELSARPTPVRVGNRRVGKRVGHRPAGIMDAVELDAPRAFARWIREHRAALAAIIEHGTWLERVDVETMIDLPVPGVDELVALLEIARFASTRRYDLTIVDTAPTGHTLRLLAAPLTVAAVADVLDALEAEHRYIRQRFARIGGTEAADRLIALIADQAVQVGATLRDPNSTAFHWVTLPEALSVAESEDAIAALTSSGIRVAEIIVNRVLPPGAPCPMCDRRRAAQRQALVRILRTIGRGRKLRLVPAELREPRGIGDVARLARRVTSSRRLTRARASVRHSERSLASNPSKRERRISPESLPAFRGAQLAFIGGKGGVGKTTVAGAVAIRLARTMPRRDVLLLSTDPAHSLGDLFGAPVGDKPSHVPRTPRNMSVREVDASRSLQEKRAALESALAEVGSALGTEQKWDDERAAQIMELAPPGIDELFGMLSIVSGRSAHDIIVVDMAPTGHSLRLLEAPEAVRVWIKALLRVLLKYRSFVRSRRLATELVGISRSIRELQELLVDHKRTRFIIVTRAASVPRAETERLLERLRRLKLSVPAIVVNARTLSPGACRRCRATADAERRELVQLARTSRRYGCAIIQSPLEGFPPRNVTALARWAQSWTA